MKRQKKKLLIIIASSLLVIILILILLLNFLQTSISLDLSLSPTEINNKSKLTLIAEASSNIENVNGRIILPEGFELVEGKLEWETDLIKNEPKEFNVIIKPVKEGDWEIQALVEDYSAVELETKVDSSLKMEIQQKVDTLDKEYIYMTWKEWKEREEERMKDPKWIGNYYRACFEVEGCRVPEPLKGKELNDYFKSLNLVDDSVYVMIQFDVLGADPYLWQVWILKFNGVELLEGSGAGGHTYFAKASKSFLENKHYDFIRWIGVREPETKLHGIDQNYTGSIDLLVLFYEGLNEEQIDEISDIKISHGGLGDNIIQVNAKIEQVNKIAELNFVKAVWLEEKPVLH